MTIEEFKEKWKSIDRIASFKDAVCLMHDSLSVDESKIFKSDLPTPIRWLAHAFHDDDESRCFDAIKNLLNWNTSKKYFQFIEKFGSPEEIQSLSDVEQYVSEVQRIDCILIWLDSDKKKEFKDIKPSLVRKCQKVLADNNLTPHEFMLAIMKKENSIKKES